jgi:succinate-acetate transporter protein
MDRDPSTPPTIVVLRPLGSPLALGLSGLAVASFLTAGFDLGWIAAAEAHTVGLLVLVTVVPTQAASALLAFAARDGASGGAFGLQSATWAALGASLLASRPGTSGATGLALLSGGALLAMLGVSAARAKLLVGAAVGASGVHFVLVAIAQLGGGPGWQNAGAIVGLAVAAIAAYTAWASQVEDMADRTIIPTGRLGGAHASLHAPFAEQVRSVQHEPGVRRQL